MERRKKLLSQRSLLICDGRPTAALVAVLRTIFSWYASNDTARVPESGIHLDRVEASRLWYRCGLKLASLESLLQAKNPPASHLSDADFLDLVSKVLEEEKDSTKAYNFLSQATESSFEVRLLV